MNIIKKFKNAIDKSKFGGIIYLICFGLIIYVAVYLVLALFSCIFYKKLTPDEYEVGYLKSYTAYDTTNDRTDDIYRGYELADDYSYFSESKENLDSLKYTRFKSDETRYLNVSSSDGKGIAYYITVKNGKYKLDLRYRT